MNASVVTSCPSSCDSEVTPWERIPQGMMVEKGDKSLLQLMAMPCIETQRLTLMPIAQIFFSLTQTPLLTLSLSP